jgi:hypothetical protein
LAENPWKDTMRFTRFSSDGNTVVEERIWLAVNSEMTDVPPAEKKKKTDARRFGSGNDAGPDRSSLYRVLAGIDALLQSTETAA